MNRAEVVAAAVEHLLPTSRLLLFGELASVGAPCQELSMVLSSYRPSDLVTGGGRFRSDDVGVSGIGGFFDEEVNALLNLPEHISTLYITLLGQPATKGSPA